jgi:hypothetical protein
MGGVWGDRGAVPYAHVVVVGGQVWGILAVVRGLYGRGFTGTAPDDPGIPEPGDTVKDKGAASMANQVPPIPSVEEIYSSTDVVYFYEKINRNFFMLINSNT